VPGVEAAITSPSPTATALAARLGFTPRSVIVVRALPGLGDMLCAVPALRALRRALPGAHVAVVTLPANAALLERFDRYVDEFVVFPGYPGIPEGAGDVRALPAFLAEIQDRRFDLALQMHGSGVVSNPFTALLGARCVAGFRLRALRCPEPGLFAPYPGDAHEVQRQLALVRFLGIADDGPQLEFPLAPDDRRDLAALPEAELLAEREYACLAPGASAPTRRWPAARFAAVGDALAAGGLRVVLTGTAAERALTADVAAAMRAPALDLAGRTRLGALAALVAGARAVVTNDSGTSHLAAALQVPSVVVFTDSSARRWAPLDGRRHRALGVAAETCTEDRCLRDGCLTGRPPHLRDVTAASVVAELEALLARAPAALP